MSNAVYEAATIINPKSAMKNEQGDIWVCVQARSEEDTNVHGNLYIIRLEPGTQASLIDKIEEYEQATGEDCKELAIDLYERPVVIPLDMPAYFRSNGYEADATRLSLTDIKQIVDISVIEFHVSNDMVNWNTVGRFHDQIRSAKSIKGQVVGAPFKSAPDDTTVRDTVGTDDANIQFGSNNIQLRTRSGNLLLSEKTIDLIGYDELNTETAMRNQGLVAENSLNHLLPENIATWIATKVKMYSVDKIIGVVYQILAVHEALNESLELWRQRRN